MTNTHLYCSVVRLMLLLFWLVPSFALAQSAPWLNEPPGATRLLNCPMTAADCVSGIVRGTWLDIYRNLTYFSPGDAPHSPPIVARASLIYPNTSGGGDLGWWDNQADRGLYMGAYFKFTAGGSSIPGFTKIFFLRTLNNLAGGAQTNGVFMIAGRDATTRQIVFAPNTGGLNNSHICGGDAFGATCFPNVGSSNFTIGQWTKFEAIVCASTSTTAQNGTVRWWVNGVEAGHYTTLNYGANVVNEWWWNQTWDSFANGQGFSGDVHQDVDHVVVSSVPASACNSTTTIDNPAGAPGLVTGFTATPGGVQ